MASWRTVITAAALLLLAAEVQPASGHPTAAFAPRKQRASKWKAVGRAVAARSTRQLRAAEQAPEQVAVVVAGVQPQEMALALHALRASSQAQLEVAGVERLIAPAGAAPASVSLRSLKQAGQTWAGAANNDEQLEGLLRLQGMAQQRQQVEQELQRLAAMPLAIPLSGPARRAAAAATAAKLDSSAAGHRGDLVADSLGGAAVDEEQLEGLQRLLGMQQASVRQAGASPHQQHLRQAVLDQLAAEVAAATDAATTAAQVAEPMVLRVRLVLHGWGPGTQAHAAAEQRHQHALVQQLMRALPTALLVHVDSWSESQRGAPTTLAEDAGAHAPPRPCWWAPPGGLLSIAATVLGVAAIAAACVVAALDSRRRRCAAAPLWRWVDHQAQASVYRRLAFDSLPAKSKAPQQPMLIVVAAEEAEQFRKAADAA